MINKMSSSSMSSKVWYRSMLAGNSAFIPGSFDLIETTILGSSAASVTFDVTGLGSTYKHLQIRSTIRDLRTGFYGSIFSIRFNADTGSNYKAHTLGGYNSSVSSGAYGETDQILLSTIAAPSATSTIFGASVIDIYDAFSSSKYKTLRNLGGVNPNGGTSTIELTSGLWLNTSALTSVTIFSKFGNLDTGSRFSLYGIKG